MKHRLLQALSCALAWIPISGITPEELAPAIHLCLEQATVPQGAPIHVEVSLQNTTTSPLLVFQLPGGQLGERCYTASAFNQKGQPVAKTEYGQWLQIHPHLSVSRIQRRVEPGHTLTDTIDFNKVFSFAKKGAYKLQVERENPLDENATIKSNIVTVEVK